MNLSSGFKYQGSKQKKHQSGWETVWGDERMIEDRHNELEVQLEHSSGIKMSIVLAARWLCDFC